MLENRITYLPDKLNGGFLLSSAILFLMLSFFQQSSLNIIASNLISSFQLNKFQLGLLESAYFFGNFLFLIPAGIILDKINIKKTLIVLNLLFSVFIIFFSISPNFLAALIARFVIGMCSAFSVITCVKITTLYFKDKIATLIGIAYFFGMVGGFMAQGPYHRLVMSFGWRVSLLIPLIMVIPILALLIKSQVLIFKNELIKEKYLKTAVFSPTLFFRSLFASLMNLPVSILGSLWGVLFLQNYFNINETMASEFCGLLFVGMAIGGLLIGSLLDILKGKILLLVSPPLMGLAIWALLALHLHTVKSYLIGVLFFLIGLLSCIQIKSYTYQDENDKTLSVGVQSSFISLSIVGISAIYEPLFGFFIDKTQSYYFPMMILILTVLTAIIPAIYLSNYALIRKKESYNEG